MQAHVNVSSALASWVSDKTSYALRLLQSTVDQRNDSSGCFCSSKLLLGPKPSDPSESPEHAAIGSERLDDPYVRLATHSPIPGRAADTEHAQHFGLETPKTR